MAAQRLADPRRPARLRLARALRPRGFEPAAARPAAAPDVELQLRLLLALSPITEVSLWADEPDRQLRCVAHAGDAAPTRRVRTIVRAVLDGDGRRGRRTSATGSTACPSCAGSSRTRRSSAARTRTTALRTRAFLQEAARCLGPVARARDAARAERRARADARRGERAPAHAARLRPPRRPAPGSRRARPWTCRPRARRSAQRVPARARRLVERTARRHLRADRHARGVAPRARALAPADEHPRAPARRGAAQRGREVRVARHDRASRSSSAASSKASPHRSGSPSTGSCRRASRTSATTARRPTCASRSTAGKGTIEVQIEDNGKGFHVEPTMIRAAKNGRLGLVGIGERVRLLGGQFDVRSRDRRPDGAQRHPAALAPAGRDSGSALRLVEHAHRRRAVLRGQLPDARGRRAAGR